MTVLITMITVISRMMDMVVKVRAYLRCEVVDLSTELHQLSYTF